MMDEEHPISSALLQWILYFFPFFLLLILLSLFVSSEGENV